MGVRLRAQIRHVGTIGHEIENNKVLRKVTRAMSVDHRRLFQYLGMRLRTQIVQVGTKWHVIENDKIILPLEGDQELGQRGLGYVAPLWRSACSWRATHLLNLRYDLPIIQIWRPFQLLVPPAGVCL